MFNMLSFIYKRPLYHSFAFREYIINSTNNFINRRIEKIEKDKDENKYKENLGLSLINDNYSNNLPNNPNNLNLPITNFLLFTSLTTLYFFFILRTNNKR